MVVYSVSYLYVSCWAGGSYPAAAADCQPVTGRLDICQGCGDGGRARRSVQQRRYICIVRFPFIFLPIEFPILRTSPSSSVPCSGLPAIIACKSLIDYLSTWCTRLKDRWCTYPASRYAMWACSTDGEKRLAGMRSTSALHKAGHVHQLPSRMFILGRQRRFTARCPVLSPRASRM
jgi:hypothetical protein